MAYYTESPKDMAAYYKWLADGNNLPFGRTAGGVPEAPEIGVKNYWNRLSDGAMDTISNPAGLHRVDFQPNPNANMAMNRESQPMAMNRDYQQNPNVAMRRTRYPMNMDEKIGRLGEE
jgi:hypothetical protein